MTGPKNLSFGQTKSPPDGLERPAVPCLAVHALCDALPEVQQVMSLLASHPDVPADVRGRCLALWYRLHDAHLAQAEELELRPTKKRDAASATGTRS